MRKSFKIIIILLFGLNAVIHAQTTVGQKYLLVNGKPTFINGANYSPSTGWFQILDN